MEVTQRLTVEDATRVGEARRIARRLAVSAGLDEACGERAALVATELASNLLKHALGRGEMLIGWRTAQGVGEMDIVALDGSPGTDDVSVWLRDGFSTSGSPGTGLGAVRRVADTFDINSSRDRGTAILARIRASGAAPPQPAVRVGGIALPIEGEEACGDAWARRTGPSGIAIVVADGLGHGPDAAAAAAEAVRVFDALPSVDPAPAIDEMAEPMRRTRGAAVAVAVIDAVRGTLRYAAVGNIAAVVAAPESHHAIVSQNGIVGHEAPRTRELADAMPPGAVLVMHSDGLKARWNLDEYPGLFWRDPVLIAGILYRDYYRGHDDVTVVVARNERDAA